MLKSLMLYTNVVQRNFTCDQVQTPAKSVSSRELAADVSLSFSHQHLPLLFPAFQGPQTHIQKTTAKGWISLSSESHNC